MKKLISSLICLMSLSNCFGMESALILMPNKQTLRSQLSSIGLDHFAEKTNIISSLADQEKYPTGVAMAIELSISDYIEYLKKSMPKEILFTQIALMDMHKPLLYETLLKNYPEALEELKKSGICK